MTAHPWEAEISPGDLMAWAERWLDRHPDEPLTDRFAAALVVASGGEIRRKVTWGDVAAVLDVPGPDVIQAALALRDQQAVLDRPAPTGGNDGQ